MPARHDWHCKPVRIHAIYPNMRLLTHSTSRLNITISMYTTLASNVTKSTAPVGGPAGGLLETTATLTNGSTTTIISSAVPTTATTGSATGTTSGGVVAGTTTAASSSSTGIAAAITGVAGRDALFGVGAGVAVGLLGGWVM
jgi:hypothetical protein